MSSSKNPSLHLSTQALFSSSALGGTGDTAASAGSPPKRSAPWRSPPREEQRGAARDLHPHQELLIAIPGRLEGKRMESAQKNIQKKLYTWLYMDV